MLGTQLKGSFIYKEFTIAYQRDGVGSEHVFAFHGFGSSPRDLDALVAPLSEAYSIWRFDLFHHGESKYPKNRVNGDTLRSEEFAAILYAFAQRERILRFSLIGYSLGGKICLCLLEEMPEMIDHVALFAPDGVEIHPIYKFASGTWLGRTLYRGFIVKPGLLFKIVGLSTAIKIVSPKMKEIVLYNMNTQAKRQLLHDVWMTYRNFRPDLKRIERTIKNGSMVLNLYFGKYDKVIRPYLATLAQNALPSANIQMLDCGHLDLVKKATMEFQILGTKKGA